MHGTGSALGCSSTGSALNVRGSVEPCYKLVKLHQPGVLSHVINLLNYINWNLCPGMSWFKHWPIHAIWPPSAHPCFLDDSGHMGRHWLAHATLDICLLAHPSLLGEIYYMP